ncbi:Uu.00g112710.m01.CDS01 [Anthostomella pinea]|uniref:Uu.00g112710.m01.CDS01 n=1 Tax=Anthostomella pinea TaxID=933095 RepID=A0AAI8VA60_9PEZI|nr:Uu.00g112710.m01.CDS01 [Anthostomella pinea]
MSNMYDDHDYDNDYDREHRSRDERDYYRQLHQSHQRDREYYGGSGNAVPDDPSYRRRESPGRGSYRDYDAPRGRGHRSPHRGDSAGDSPPDSGDDGYYRDSSRRSGPTRPSHTLKLDDVPDWMNTEEVDNIMRDMGAAGLVEVRLKFDDRGASRRCYAFAEFRSIDDATSFLDNHYPALDVNGANGHPARIYLEYSRERRPVANPDDWMCTMCHFENFSRRATCKQCKAPRSSESTADMKLDGKSDECPQQTPSQFVVIRGLPSSVTETTLAAGVKKLYVTKEADEPKQAPGAPPKLKSTAPIGNTSGLGAKPGSLIRVFMIRDKYSDISCNYGFAEFSTLEDAKAAVAKYNASSPQFTISSKPVTIAFIHSGVFIPYLHPVQDQDRKFTFSATHNPTLRLVYWNSSVYANEFLIFNEGLYEDKPQETGQTKKDGDSSAGKDSRKRKAEKDLAAPSGKKAIAMAPQLQMWASKHAELHGPKGPGQNSTSSEGKAPATGSNAIGPAATTLPTAPPPSVSSVSYADLDRMCCLLCRRKFSNEPSLRRHEQISDLHKANLENEALVIKAVKDLNALGKEPVSSYRDRAKERRVAHNQPSKPKPHLPRKKPQGNKEPESAKETPAKPAISKGAGLLAKMGWTSGEGLGAEGGGRTNIIETTAYAPGVGLGAEGGKRGDAAQEAARATRNDYADFVSKAKDKARERYEKMG